MTRLHSSFTRYIYWPLVQKIKGEYAARILGELSESQWKSQDELVASQWELVRKTVNKSVREVPYYQKICSRSGWDANNEKFSCDDFLNFPITEKESLRDQIKEILNPNYRGRVTRGKTSGSTGHSLKLFYNSEHESYSEAARWRAKYWWGVKLGFPQISIWGRPYTGCRDRFEQTVKSYLMNTRLFSAFDINDDHLSFIWEKISKFKPDIIYGYPSAIFPLSVFLKDNNKKAYQLGVKVIIITAESITTQQRKLIEEVFGCKTANEYGCSETGGFVYECPHGNWHISSEIEYVEFLDKDGKPVQQGQTGEIVITHLRNDYMPLIRYRVGDMGAPLSGVCDCGRGLPLMKVSVAKESDIFRLLHGQTFSSEIFDYINLAVIQAYPSSIRQFRVVQKKMDIFEVEVVLGSDTSGSGENLFKRLMEKQLGSKLQIYFRRVPALEREPTGKLRYFISEV
ncbi:phenylacetate--CoA ligase family protein [Thermodesulfobacteriota bacterium]